MTDLAESHSRCGPVPSGSEGPRPLQQADLISTLFRENNRALVNFLLTHLSNEQEAREVAQEAYVKLLQLDRPEAISFLRTYLFRIAANLAIDRLRRSVRKDRIERRDVFDEWAGSPLVEREVLAAQELALVRKAISELKPNYQRAFILHKFRDCSIAQIAVDMGMSPRMVRSYIARSVCYCRLRLDGEPAAAALDLLKELMP
jgi:RNA polymerase sigma factor (sigma-70 family)